MPAVDEQRLPLDVLSAGSSRPGHPRLLAVLAGAALALVGVGATVDTVSRRSELDAVLQQVTAGQIAVTGAQRRAALEIGSRRGLDRAAWDPAVYYALQEVLRGSAGATVGDVRRVAGSVATTDVLPWHGDLRAAREHYLGYLEGMAAHLSAVADAEVAPDEPAPPATLRQLDAARSALVRASADDTLVDRALDEDGRPG